ncbi:MAG: tyrosine--tRNA ligase [SAR202 cluster bacterium]|nr:tyrosine--tRNA ligase [SAR202 cluster bacterium]MQG36128.1 tyrosine--tRNA ligase [SAR202 cluster bacterium]MQG85829.1 tyrosine--tRNA ligase [SAR202 cluster bacterium]|tara:strand:+ start:10766 stop:11959 length:1194 start_codon:yes stop_codon:yes gene_type:complete
MIDNEIIEKITKRGVKEIISETEFVNLLQSGKKLRLKMGFDPSRADIHLGHVVGLRKLKQLQDLGHEVILIVGDWTAQIGDPSGQSVTRPMLTHDDVIANAQSYMDQFFRVVDKNQTQVVWQSEWFGKFSLADVIELTSKFTVAQFLERDDFALRFKEHKPIAITEFLYPLLQAYDSVAIESDVEFGGTDQMFNLLVGRTLQQIKGMRPQQCFMMPILVGTDGINKMSKSLDNYISLDDTSNDMYGKVMSLPDSCIMTYFELLTDVPTTELHAIERELSANAMNAKKLLAHTITETFFDSQIAGESQQNFENVVQNRGIPDDIPKFPLAKAPSLNSVLLESGSVSSNSELKRLYKQNAVQMISVKGETSSLTNDVDTTNIESGTVIKVGKRRYIKLI